LLDLTEEDVEHFRMGLFPANRQPARNCAHVLQNTSMDIPHALNDSLASGPDFLHFAFQ